MFDDSPIIIRNFTERMAPPGMVIEYFVPRNVDPLPFQLNRKVRLMVKGVKFGFFAFQPAEMVRCELRGIAVIPQNGEEVSNEMIQFVSDGKKKIHFRIVQENEISRPRT